MIIGEVKGFESRPMGGDFPRYRLPTGWIQCRPFGTGVSLEYTPVFRTALRLNGQNSLQMAIQGEWVNHSVSVSSLTTVLRALQDYPGLFKVRDNKFYGDWCFQSRGNKHLILPAHTDLLPKNRNLTVYPESQWRRMSMVEWYLDRYDLVLL